MKSSYIQDFAWSYYSKNLLFSTCCAAVFSVHESSSCAVMLLQLRVSHGQCVKVDSSDCVMGAECGVKKKADVLFLKNKPLLGIKLVDFTLAVKSLITYNIRHVPRPLNLSSTH